MPRTKQQPDESLLEYFRRSYGCYGCGSRFDTAKEASNHISWCDDVDMREHYPDLSQEDPDHE